MNDERDRELIHDDERNRELDDLDRGVNLAEALNAAPHRAARQP